MGGHGEWWHVGEKEYLATVRCGAVELPQDEVDPASMLVSEVLSDRLPRVARIG